MPKRATKPVLCPECGAAAGVPILYGLPSPEFINELEPGTVAFGGCAFSDDSPQWFCRNCEHEW